MHRCETSNAVQPFAMFRHRCASGIALALYLWASSTGIANARVWEGVLPAGQRNFAMFLGKFCIDFDRGNMIVGRIEVSVKQERQLIFTPSTGNRLLFMVFDDEKTHWKKVRRRWPYVRCEDEGLSSYTQHINLSSLNSTSFITITEHVRPRFWYFAFVACDLEVELPQNVEYKVHATNEKWGAADKEFSFDRLGLLKLYSIMIFAFIVVTLVTSWATRGERREHPYIKMLLLSLIASTASSLFFLGHYAIFSRNGFGSERLRFLGILSGLTATCTIFLIGILSSVGWAITCSTLPHPRAFLGGVAVVGGIDAICELHAQISVDASTQLYSYQSGPGVFALIMKVFMFCWFAFHIKTTHDEELSLANKKLFKIMAVSFTLCFLSVPVTVIVAFSVSPWYRFKVVVITETIMRCASQVLLSFIFCGPISPISADNIPRRELINVDLNDFSQMSDGIGHNGRR